MDRKLLIFDFDGVLSIPWTRPEVCYSQIPDLIKKLSQTHILAMASFNPRAQIALVEWDLDKYFFCTRYGSNHRWDGLYEQKFRSGMSKTNQIIDMLECELSTENYTHIEFFDDDLNNLIDVNNKLPSVKTCLIDAIIGFRLEDTL